MNSKITVQEFVSWVQRRYQLPNTTQSVKKAADLLRVTDNAIHKWESGLRKLKPSTQLSMELMIENDELRKELDALKYPRT